MSTAELATSYAALILADDGVDITVCDSEVVLRETPFQDEILTYLTYRPTSLLPLSRLLVCKMSNPSGPLSSLRSVNNRNPMNTSASCDPHLGWGHGGYKMKRVVDNYLLQALEGKDVKDMLLNVGSGGGAAPAAGAAAGGAAADGEAPAEAAEEA